MESKTTTIPAAIGSANTDEATALAPTIMSLGFGMTETAIASVFGLAQDLRGETKNAITATFDGAEETLKSALRAGRKVHTRLDDVTEAALSRFEVGLRVILRALWKTSDDVVGVAGRTVVSVAGQGDKRNAA